MEWLGRANGDQREAFSRLFRSIKASSKKSNGNNDSQNLTNASYNNGGQISREDLLPDDMLYFSRNNNDNNSNNNMNSESERPGTAAVMERSQRDILRDLKSRAGMHLLGHSMIVCVCMCICVYIYTHGVCMKVLLL